MSGLQVNVWFDLSAVEGIYDASFRSSKWIFVKDEEAAVPDDEDENCIDPDPSEGIHYTVTGTLDSLLSTQYSPFSTPNSVLPTQYSVLPTQCSLLSTQYYNTSSTYYISSNEYPLSSTDYSLSSKWWPLYVWYSVCSRNAAFCTWYGSSLPWFKFWHRWKCVL